MVNLLILLINRRIQPWEAPVSGFYPNHNEGAPGPSLGTGGTLSVVW
jgi:hypothetical protein